LCLVGTYCILYSNENDGIESDFISDNQWYMLLNHSQYLFYLSVNVIVLSVTTSIIFYVKKHINNIKMSNIQSIKINNPITTTLFNNVNDRADLNKNFSFQKQIIK
jgi:hypothetical protein